MISILQFHITDDISHIVSLSLGINSSLLSAFLFNSQNESLAILENISQHLSYINSCLDYIHKNWSAHQTLADDGQQDGTTVCHLSDITKKLLLKAPKLQISLQRLDNDMKKVWFVIFNRNTTILFVGFFARFFLFQNIIINCNL